MPARTERDIMVNVECQLFLADFRRTLNFVDIFSENTEISNFMIIPCGGSSRVAPCGQTDRHDKANSRFSHFCERA